MGQQQGSALIVSLLILLVMTIIGISAMSSSTLEEKMAASDRSQKAVFQNAEISLKTAEQTLTNEEYDNGKWFGTKGYRAESTERLDYNNPTAWTDNCIDIANNSNGGSSCYIAEEVGITNSGELAGYDGDATRIQILRISVRSTLNNGSATIVQSYINKPTN